MIIGTQLQLFGLGKGPGKQAILQNQFQCPPMLVDEPKEPKGPAPLPDLAPAPATSHAAVWFEV